jgi:hypothetical protein
MLTLVAMVTIGADNWTRRFSVRRAEAYARKHGYDFVRITKPSLEARDRTPHWEKTLIPRAYPNYERYLVIDDDILINHRIAPSLPEISNSMIGLVREPLPASSTGPVPWVGNTGVMLVSCDSRDLFETAYAEGEVTDIVPGFGEQPAINKVAWAQQRISRMDWKWNYILMADWLINVHRQDYPWKAGPLLGRFAKLTLFVRLLWELIFNRRRLSAHRVVKRLNECYFVHLIAFRMGAIFVDTLLR